MLPNLILLPYYYKRENIVCIKLVLAQREERRIDNISRMNSVTCESDICWQRNKASNCIIMIRSEINIAKCIASLANLYNNYNIIL